MTVVAKEASGCPMLNELDLVPLAAEHLKERLVVSVVLAGPLTVDRLKEHLIVLVVLAGPLTVDRLKEHLIDLVVLAGPLTVDHLKAHLVALAVLVVPIVHALPEFVAPCHRNQRGWGFSHWCISCRS